MPQPEALNDLQEPLIDSYKRAWQRVQFEQQMLETDPLAFRRKLRLTEMRKAIEAEMNQLDLQAAEWISNQLPQAYSAGMSSAPAAASATWSQIHQEAVEELGAQLFSELLQATQGVRDSTKELVRTVARDQALAKAIQGKTAVDAGKEMQRVLGEKGIFSVTYSDGSKHGLAEYSQVAMRTTTAKAYNRGTLNAHDDVKFFEVFDGPGCGLTKHDDPQLALGMVISREDCEKYPISHPNCRRAFGPRPDITRANQANTANPTSTTDQRRAQLEADAARGDREAQRELAGQRKADDVFTKRQKRLDEQKERNRAADRLAAEKQKAARLAERQAKLDAKRLGEEQAKLLREAQEAAERAASNELFPELPRLDAPEDYSTALRSVNPGQAATERRNNCHMVTASMEMRARGYDVIASPTFKNEGRYTPSIEADWVDPATGSRRRFSSMPVQKLRVGEIESLLLDRTKDWPPNSRGFLVGSWKKGGAHIWNVHKDPKGRLIYTDGQVADPDVKKYLSRVNNLSVMRVDDLVPVADRLRFTSKPKPVQAAGSSVAEQLAEMAKKLDALGPRPSQLDDFDGYIRWGEDRNRIQKPPANDGSIRITREQQIETGLQFMEQYMDDLSIIPPYYRIDYLTNLSKFETDLKTLGVKEPYATIRERREALAASPPPGR